MNNFLSSIDTLFNEYNIFIKQKHKNIKFDLNSLYYEFKENNNLTLENGKKKGKNAYQNFFTITRKELQDKNLPFGEQSKIISNRWKALSSTEKKKYDTQFLDEKMTQPSSSTIENYFIAEHNSESESESDSELHLVNEKEDDDYKSKNENGEDEDDANQYQNIESDLEEDDNDIDEVDSVDFNFQD